MTKEQSSLWLAIGILFVAFIVFCNPIAIVGVGERGVKVTLGKVSPESYSEGIHFVMPFIQKNKSNERKNTKTINPNRSLYKRYSTSFALTM